MSKAPNPPRKSVQPSDRSVLRYAGMGTQLLVIMLVFTFGGYKLDRYLELKAPIFTVSLSLVGIFAAFYLTLKDLLRSDKRK